MVWSPEKAALDAAGRGEVGVAFDAAGRGEVGVGGGTRAAAAAVGQLRGLRDNGWLDRDVRYVAAVSGGSWAAVPFTYGDADLDLLLGPMTSPGELSRIEVTKELLEGSLSRSIARSKLLAPGATEAARIWARAELDERDVSPAIRSFTRRFLGGSTDQTYASLLGRLFIEPHVTGGTELRYTWNEASIDAIKALNPKLSVTEFLRASEGRPFLIAGGTMISHHPAYDYPRLIPVEYTPLYTGVRQQYGNRLGGLYVSPYAYDVATADQVETGNVRVTTTRSFTLADVIASSGAAPLLALSRGWPVPAAERATAIFPSFNHFTVREQEEGPAVQPLTEGLLHGDGGFTDNLGVMPLLARGVTKILVFVNGKEPFERSKQVESMFWPLDQQEDAGGDRSMNAVFDPSHYWELRDGLRKGVEAGGAAVYCGRSWEVRPNELYNVTGYTGLNICWVYNELVPTWVGLLPDETREMVESRNFRNFPWFSTFGENIPYVMRLKREQVTLLAGLAAWSVTNSVSRDEMADALGL